VSALRLVPAGGRSLGGALATIGSATLARRDGGAYVEVEPAAVSRLVRALAFGGIAATQCVADLGPRDGLIAAIGRDLTPLPAALVPLDVVRVRRVALGPATREILRRRLFGLLPAAPSARLRCRSLLRDASVMLLWGRHAWASRAALRSLEVRRSLRPVVFDRDALDRAELPGRTTSADDDLARWLFA
jgi:hypothetical protein